jgi:hypothetical protein
MLVTHVALTVEKDKLVSTAELMRVGAALQKQVSRDFAHVWGVHATVSAFGKMEDVPLGYWPVIVTASVNGAAGYHEDKNGQPFALVEAGPSWSLTASHEALEMLADPFGKRLMAGTSPKPKQGRVEFLVEVCDPSEDEKYAYMVNGVLVSDFYTPHYFDPVKTAGVHYSYTGAITAPRQVLPGGYLSWHDPVSDHWFQELYFNGKRTFKNLGKFDAKKFGSYRSFTNFHTPEVQRLSQLAKGSPMMKSAAASTRMTDDSTASKATLWRDQIHALRNQKKA